MINCKFKEGLDVGDSARRVGGNEERYGEARNRQQLDLDKEHIVVASYLQLENDHSDGRLS